MQPKYSSCKHFWLGRAVSLYIQYLLNIQEIMIMLLHKPTDRLLQNLVSFLQKEHFKAS